MLTRAQSALTQKSGLLPGQLLLVGVSGGADSLVLLDILDKLGYPLVIAHFNHLLRPEASSDAQAVRLLAAKMGFPFTLAERSVPAYAESRRLSIEEAARELRYRFLFEQAQIHKAQAVVVAHHADDQVETVLMHLLRGAGLDGLAGMPYHALPNPWSETIPLVRPLLDVWRAEIEQYCAEHGLTPLADATNADTTYFRNRLRHHLIPELETYVPGFRSRLWQTTDLLTADRRLLDELTEKAWQETQAECGDKDVRFHLQSFNLQSLALQRRLIRKAIAHLRPAARDLGFALVRRALNFTTQPTATGQADLGLGLCVFLEAGMLVIADWDAALPTSNYPQITARCPLDVPGELNFGEGWVLRAEWASDVAAAKREAAGNRDPYRAWADLGDRQPLLSLRPRLPGERFQPWGMAGHSVKLSDFMINQKIPQRARDHWPLVCAGDEIIWLPGYRLAQPFGLRAQTRRVLRLFLEREEV